MRQLSRETMATRPTTPARHGRAERAGRRRHVHPVHGGADAGTQIRGRGRLRFAAKRSFDVIVATLSVVVLSPVFAGITLWLLATSGRPVLYRQVRVGRRGIPFTLVKFRSMVHDAHDQRHELREHNERTGPLFKIGEDPRVTKAGRFLRASSLDELPQLFNVIGGTMSLVGPRPALYEERESFPPELLAREQVRPGITGLWQVRARHDPDFDRYHELDLEYVRSWTLLGDVWLLLRTPWVIAKEFFRRRPAATVDEATVPGPLEVVSEQTAP